MQCLLTVVSHVLLNGVIDQRDGNGCNKRPHHPFTALWVLDFKLNKQNDNGNEKGDEPRMIMQGAHDVALQ